METRKSTTAGVLFWTPAPAHTSPSSSVISEDLWEDEDDEQAGKDADFVSQMDENGIIGLSEALEHVELVEDAEYDPNFYPGRRTTEEPDLCRHEVGTPHEELSYNLSEHLSHSESPGEDGQILSPYDDLIGSFTAQAMDEDAQGIGCLLERDKYLDMTEMGKDGTEAGKRSDRKRKINEHSSTLGELRTHYGLAESSSPYCSAHLRAMEPAGDSSHRCQTSHPASPVTASSLAHLLRFTAEEMAACPRIEAETFPEISFTESLPDSHRSHRSLKSSPRPEIKLTAFTRPASTISVEVTSNHYSGVNNGPSTGSFKSDKHDKQPTPSPRKMKQQSPRAAYSSGSLGTDSLKCKHQTSSPDRELRTPRARSNAAEVDEPSKGSLSFRTPDFSKVEPKVRFPKAGYKPPKSRRSFKRDSLSPEPPLVFKSPADIVKEVLLNIPDGSPAPQDSYTLPASAPDFTVPQEFRSPRHATTLLEQLQEQYNTLLTKYAEAENTIDRLRLEAKPRQCQHGTGRALQYIRANAKQFQRSGRGNEEKEMKEEERQECCEVNLYSDPPKPGHSVQSGLNQRASRIMMLDFPQAQRAETNSASLNPNGHSTPQRSSSAGPSTRSPVPQVGQQLAVILYIQTDKFLQQLQTFEDLLKCKKLKPLEEVKGVSQLTEGLDSLERGYLLARDQHKLLQQQGAEISHFDPERELEGLIFQCGLRMDELKEQVEQTQQEQSTCRTPSPSTPLPNSSSVPSEGGEILTQPQGPPQPWMVDPGQAAVEVSSVNEESDEETLNSLDLSALNEHRRREQDFADHNQSFQELPKHIDHSQREGARPPAAGRTNMQHGEEEERQSQGTGSMDVTKSLLQRKSDHVDSPPPCTSKQQTSRTSPPSRSASSQSTMFPVDPTSSRRLEVGKSHSSSLSSLGEINTSQRRNSKLLSGSSRVLSQDGIISPETDSGFVGSESSRLTPAAAHSPLHQRASESVPGPQDGKPRRPQTGLISAPPRASSPTHSRTAMEPNKGCQLASEQPRRSRQGRRGRTFSCSPQRWISQTERSRAGSETSEFGLQSDSSHCVSEDEQNDRYTDSISPLHSSSQSSSPAERRHHGNSLQALSSSQVANRNEAIQTLQAEVTRLRERLESFRSNKKPPSTVRAAPSAPQNTSTPRVRRGDVSRGRSDRQTVDESTLRRTARNRPSSVHTQKPKPEILTAAEPSPPQPPPLVSRCTQTSTAAPDNSCSHTHTVRSRNHPRQQSGVSVQVCETADEPDRGSRQAPICPQCLSSQQGRAGGPLGGNKEPTHSSRCRHCPVCGCRDPYASTEPDCRRVSDSPPHTRHQPATSPDGAARSRHFAAAAPATLLQYMPVCSQPLLLYSAPLYISPGNSTGTSSGVRVREEARGRTRRSLSTDKQRSTDSSLNRAITAARHMKHTSGHMARSLAAGLHYQELLSQSCSY